MDATEIIISCDAERARKQLQAALSHLNRTETWLVAQRAYLRGVADFSEDELTRPDLASPNGGGPPAVPPKDMMMMALDQASVLSPAAAAAAAAAASTAKQKKAVRFSDVSAAAVTAAPLPRTLSFHETGRPQQLHAFRPESAFYRAFTDAAVRRCAPDAFIQRQVRFEALQAQRVVLRDAHRDRLLGKYQLSVVEERNAAARRRRMSANVARGDYHDENEGDGDKDKDPEQVRAEAEQLRRDKEAEAVSQMTAAAWHVAATKLLNGGRLVAAPVEKRLARRQSWVSVQVNAGGGAGRGGAAVPATHSSTAAATTTTMRYQDRPRILDLGGQGTCDWGWHAAMQWPNAKVYTVTTKAIRQLSNSNIRGPPNHRQVAVERLTRLPFADNQFDLVSARELHAVLKVARTHGDVLAEQKRQRQRKRKQKHEMDMAHQSRSSNNNHQQRSQARMGSTSQGQAGNGDNDDHDDHDDDDDDDNDDDDDDENDNGRCSAGDAAGDAPAPDDEWDACLRECLRVLKPGGFLEFSVLDADLVNPGPLGHAKAVEFGFVLRTMSYDPAPTRTFLARLRRAGFASVRRAWMCLPAGPRTRSDIAGPAAMGMGLGMGVGIPPLTPRRPPPSPSPSFSLFPPPSPAPTLNGRGVRGTNASEHVRPQEQVTSSSSARALPSPSLLGPNAPPTGSANDVAAVTGLAAGWSWERWLLRAGMERAAGELKLQMGSAAMAGGGEALAREAAGGGGSGSGGGMVADVYAVVEEGRARGSAFRMLKGYAQKPVPRIVVPGVVGAGPEMQQRQQQQQQQQKQHQQHHQVDGKAMWEREPQWRPEWEWERQVVIASLGGDDGGMESPKGSESSDDTHDGDRVMISMVLDTNSLC